MIYGLGDKIRVINVFNADEDRGEWGEIIEERPNNNWRVKVYFSDGQWDIFTLHESAMGGLAEPAPATAPAAGVVGDYAKGYDAGLLDGYTGVDADWVARFEARQVELERELAETRQRLAAALDAMRTLQKAGLSEVIEHYKYRAYIADIYGDIRETLSATELTGTVNGLQCVEAALQAAQASADGGE